MSVGGRIRLPIGAAIGDCAVMLCAAAREAGEERWARVNWVTLTAGPNDDPVELVRAYREAARRADRQARAGGPSLTDRLLTEARRAWRTACAAPEGGR